MPDRVRIVCPTAVTAFECPRRPRSRWYWAARYEFLVRVAAYSTNVYSSRGIECRGRQDIAYRVITANRVPDHATVARFVCRHEVPLGELFASVLRL
ncbi:MAG: transposase, partial [Solirubrobacteraceae bacterium]